MTASHARQARPARRHARSLAVLAGLSAALVPHTAQAARSDAAAPVAADTPDGATPQPYGGQLGHVVTPDPVDVADVGLLVFGAINALGMVACGTLDALRGPSAGRTRRAMIARTDRGTVSGRPRPPRCPAPVAAPRPRGAHRRGRHLPAVGPA